MFDKEKVISWLKKPENIILLAILVIAFIIRWKYYAINIGSSYWWDEATYLNSGKFWAFGEPFWQVEQARPPLFMFLIAVMYKLGFNEAGIRFFAVLIPSMLVVFMTYLLGKEMYNKKIGLISAFIMSTFWVLVFNTSRVHTDPLATFLGILALYLFWKGYVVKKKASYILLLGIVIALGYLTRLNNLIILAIIGLYLLITEGVNFLKYKPFYITAVIGFLLTIPYMVWGKANYGRLFPWLAQYYSGAAGEIAKTAIRWDLINFIPLYLKLVLFIVFLIGLITLIDLFLGFDLIKKENRLKADLLNVIAIALVLVMFMFVFRAAEPRWMMLMTHSVFFIAAKGIVLIEREVEKYSSKQIALAIVVIILLIGGWQELQHNEGVIDSRINSFGLLIPAGQWLKENTDKDDKIITANVQAELTYNSEREMITYRTNEDETLEFIEREKPKYLILTAYYPSARWNYEFPGKYPEKFVPIQGYFFDNDPEKPAVIIYEVKY